MGTQDSFKELTYKINGAVFEVFKELGAGV